MTSVWIAMVQPSTVEQGTQTRVETQHNINYRINESFHSEKKLPSTATVTPRTKHSTQI
jgi:hypothetical protein